MSLSHLRLGVDTFTSDQVLRELVGDSSNRSMQRPGSPPSQCNVFYNESPFRGKDGLRIKGSERQNCLEAFCMRLHRCAQNAQDHFALLDQTLSSLVCRQVVTTDPDQEVVKQTCHVLCRLPEIPPKINFNMFLWSTPRSNAPLWSKDYFKVSLAENYSTPMSAIDPPLEDLRVVSSLGTSTIQLALHITTTQNGGYMALAKSIKDFVDLLAELLDIADGIRTRDGGATVQSAFIIKAFLWTTWQRSIMLFFWNVLGNQLHRGWNSEWSSNLALRGCSLLAHRSVQSALNGWANTRASYMCTWAFELLKTSRGSIGLDFRKFHEVFAEMHSNRSARCLWNSDEPCDGTRPESCGRFADRRLVANDQSAHDILCAGDCRRVSWSKKSYQHVVGGRAVLLESNAKKIRYCEASETTLAISHVWSHGQGGRPDTGINLCLHHRYIRLAREHGCTSYWIDTLCIPDDHELRAEAIGYINRTFVSSKVTLVCDKDLMNIDTTKFSVQLIESLLVTLLVCDWNVRAWTFLEAMKGSHGLCILCKDNKTIFLRDALLLVHQEGSIDLAVLFLAMQQFLPSHTEAFRRNSPRQSIEEASSLLCHRHATRSGDDVVIWSLLSGIKVTFTAEELWRTKRRVRTGFLMSSAPRIENVQGMGWAPRTPCIRLSDDSDALLNGHYLSYDGEGSDYGEITPKGLMAEWFVFEVKIEEADLYKEAPITMARQDVNGIWTTEELQHVKINRCWTIATDLLQRYKYVILMQPRSLDHRPYTAAVGRGESHGPLVAVCASDDEKSWNWKGVYEWSIAVPLPNFEVKDILLV